ncbi:hypothetical protein V8E54_011635 [Elaphomyces granulatus]
MIPPCDPTVLDSNPQFKRLRQQLTTTLLNQDGSTRADDRDPPRIRVVEQLRACQIRHAKRQIVKKAVAKIALDSRNGFPDELRDVAAIIALYLQCQTPLDELDYQDSVGEGTLSLLDPDINEFQSNIGGLAPYLSTSLTATVNKLQSIAETGITTVSSGASSTSTMPVDHSRARALQPPLSLQLSDRLRHLRAVQTNELPASRRQMAMTAAAVLAARAELMERTVVLLERTKHGVLARASKAKAEHLATVAEGVEKKIRYTTPFFCSYYSPFISFLPVREKQTLIHSSRRANSHILLRVVKLETLSAIYTPETVAALSHYREHLRDTRIRLEEKQKIAIQELEAYEAAESGLVDGDNEQVSHEVAGRGSNRSHQAGVGPMIDIARRYGALIKEVESVKMEIRRLDG